MIRKLLLLVLLCIIVVQMAMARGHHTKGIRAKGSVGQSGRSRRELKEETKDPKEEPKELNSKTGTLDEGDPKEAKDEKDDKDAKAEKAGKAEKAEASGKKKNTLKGPSKRECKASHKPVKVEFECASKVDDAATDAHIEDKIKFKVTTGTRGIGINVGYEQEIDTDAADTETETKYEVVFGNLMEYAKADGFQGTTDESHAYDWANDEIVQMIPLYEWKTFSDIADDDEGVVSYFEVSSGNGLATFNFTVSRADQGERVTANRMKIDVLLTSFPWKRDDTYLALLSTVESKKKIEVAFEETSTSGSSATRGPKEASDVFITFEEAQSALDAIPFGEYTWEPNAQVLEPMNGNDEVVTIEFQRSIINELVTPTDIQVVATSPSAADDDGGSDADAAASQNIAFSFVGAAAQTADIIYWDPEAGIGYEDPNAVTDDSQGDGGDTSDGNNNNNSDRDFTGGADSGAFTSRTEESSLLTLSLLLLSTLLMVWN